VLASLTAWSILDMIALLCCLSAVSHCARLFRFGFARQ
jgi:hypothetical protein